MADGKLVQMLIFTDVTRYLEFKVIYLSYLYGFRLWNIVFELPKYWANWLQTQFNLLKDFFNSEDYYIFSKANYLFCSVAYVGHIQLHTGGSISSNFKCIFVIILGINWSHRRVMWSNLHQIVKKHWTKKDHFYGGIKVFTPFYPSFNLFLVKTLRN